jgi:hypothetical protein
MLRPIKIMKKKQTWKPLAAEHTDELIMLIAQAYHLANRTPSMRRLAADLIKIAGWRWTADAVNPSTGIVVKDAIKQDIRYLPHSADAALVIAQYPKELGKRLTHEHTIPLGLLAEKVLSLETDDREVIRQIFSVHCRAALITKEEDGKLRSAKLHSAMPSGWSFGGDILARYSAVGIKLLPPSLNRE